jgi:hypothetical protein
VNSSPFLVVTVAASPMKLVSKNKRRSWAWLSGVFDSFEGGRGEDDDFWGMLPFCCE